MATSQEQLARLRRYNLSVRENDPKLAEEVRDRGFEAMVTEAASPEAAEEMLGLESIALRTQRPVLAIRDNVTRLVFIDEADSKIWGERLTKARPLLDVAIPAVGRIDLTGSPLDWVGTGWLVAENIIVTNRHVAREFAERKGDGFAFKMGLSEQMGADLDFLQEIDNPKKLVFKLVRPLHIEEPPGPDVAFFEIEMESGDARLAKPIELATTIVATQEVATIGYPAYDSRVPQPDLMERIYGKVYNKKRLAPGSLQRLEEMLLWHNCTTLGGNDGSVVFDLNSGQAVGLHIAGSFLATNYAVRSDVVKNLLVNARSGRVVRRTARIRPVSVFFSAARADEEQASLLFHRLKEAGFSLWKRSESLMPGADWIRATEEALARADVALFFISGSSDSQQLSEMETAVRLNVSLGRPLIIPCRHEQLPIPPPISSIAPIDLDEEGGWERLVAAVHPDALSSATPKPPESLVQACLSGSCVLYAGSGLSAPSGFPTWIPLVNNLAEWLRMQKLAEPKSVALLASLAATGDVDTAADEIVAITQSANAEALLTEHLKETFVRHPPPLNHYHLRLSAIPFCAALTTNFDQLLEACFPNTEVLTPNDSQRLLECLTKNEFFILKLYGAFNRSDPVLVAPAQYTDTVVGNVAFAQFIESLFVSRTLFFVGCSLEGIQAYLEGLKFRRSNRQHYALVGVSGRAWEARAQILNRRYGIEVIPYSLANNHIEVAEFLDHLVGQIRPQESLGTPNISKPITVRREARRLKRVSLSGIGLFDHFELELTPNWNILLGNNGVGKSTILKAIAIGLCGRDAQPYVERLLKRGVPSGTIVLETSDGTQYFTDIMRTSGAIEVVARPARSLDAEGWLALGFPPLRLLTWERPTGPMLQESRARPEAADLIPIISGGLDPRLDTLKQWILTLDYLIKDERTRGGSGDRPQQLLNEFFSIMGKLTGDLVLEFHGVEAGREVLVRTDDGIVPIEAVSQGMASLLGWVGVFMQRLYMVFDQEPKPTEQYAMVLIDEIDAHMHPEWQQNLVSSLSKAFPHVQFIATTHSPLIWYGRSPHYPLGAG